MFTVYGESRYLRLFFISENALSWFSVHCKHTLTRTTTRLYCNFLPPHSTTSISNETSSSRQLSIWNLSIWYANQPSFLSPPHLSFSLEKGGKGRENGVFARNACRSNQRRPTIKEGTVGWWKRREPGCPRGQAAHEASQPMTQPMRLSIQKHELNFQWSPKSRDPK